MDGRMEELMGGWMDGQTDKDTGRIVGWRSENNDSMTHKKGAERGGLDRHGGVGEKLHPVEGQAQHESPQEQGGAGAQGPGGVVVLPMAVALVGPVAVLTETALHLGSGVGVVALLAECLVGTRLHHRV